MRRWLIKQWHRFTLGRTARPVRGSLACGGPGSMAHVAYMIESAVYEGLPLCIAHEVVTRRALDVPLGTIRIVLETCR